MTLERLVADAAGGSEKAATALVRRFRNMVLATAVAIVRDTELAQDITQESFLAALSGLGHLRNPGSFPQWLRGITRRQAKRALASRSRGTLPIDYAAGLPSEVPGPDEQLAHRDLAARVLAAMAELPASHREAFTLRYIERFTQRAIADFLGIRVTTVNNRIHAARERLRDELLDLAEDIVKKTALSVGFATHVGRIVRVLGRVVDVRFETGELPDVLEQLIAPEAPRHARLVVEVASRLDDRTVRCVAATPLRSLRGKTELARTVEKARTLPQRAVRDSVRTLAARSRSGRRTISSRADIIETGIKVIDVFCPIPRNARIGVAGNPKAGKLVLVQELLKRLAHEAGGTALFSFVRAEEAGWARQAAAAPEPSALAFFLLSDGIPGKQIADELDVLLVLSPELAARGLYPAIDPLRSLSKALDPAIVQAERYQIAMDARAMLEPQQSDSERAQRLRFFLSQPFYVAEPFTRVPGTWVRSQEAVAWCREIIGGKLDHVPLERFYFTGLPSVG